MAAVDFPASPAIGQIFSPGGGLPQYVWTGTVWNSYGTSQPKTWMSLAASPPASPVDGDFWWQTDTGLLFVRYNDGNSVQWVAVSPAMSLAGLDTRYKQINDGGVFKVASGLTVANLATVDIALPAGYTAFELMIASLTTTSGGSLYMQMSVDGTTFLATNYQYVWNATVTGTPAANQPNGSSNDIGWLLGVPVSNANNRLHGKITIPVSVGAAEYQHVMYQTSYLASTAYVTLIGQGLCGAGPIKALRLLLSGGATIASGLRWQLNGWK